MQTKAFGYLIELSQSGSFYRAAKNLGISQQGLNKTISSLENELGAKLIERSASGVRLTRKGEMVLQRAREINDSYNQLMHEMLNEQIPEADSGNRVTVHVSYYSAQIASTDPHYVSMLTKNLIYIEAPFDKLLRYAELSDGTDLVFADVHEHTMQKLRDNKNVRFEPVFHTRYGFLWKEGSALASEKLLHRETVACHPVAINSSRETTKLLNQLFAEVPLQDVRIGSTSMRLLLEYVQASQDTACIIDSFSYYLLKKYNVSNIEGLHFTPLSTPKAYAGVGFLLPTHVALSPQARGVVETLRRYLQIRCPDYMLENPYRA